MASGAAAPALDRAPSPTLRTLEDIAALAQAHGAPVLKVHIENDIHLVRLEPGQLEFRPSAARAAQSRGRSRAEAEGLDRRALGGDGGARRRRAHARRTARKSAAQARLESVMQEPLVRAVLDRFPGAEIVAVRDVADEEIASAPEEDSE